MSFLFHDYETFGPDPKRDRPAQFAAIRTDDQLNPIGEPISIHMKPDPDLLPDPIAVLITGITPQHADRLGLTEPQFFADISEQMMVPKTCTLGFNSIRFDDEVTRFGFWRNFFEPYAREWQGGNSRFDLIDVARMCYALRPEGIEWPEHEPGKPSFRLEHLASANRLTHTHAHDALSDVEATIGLARLIRTQQRRLFDFLLTLRDKRCAAGHLDWAHRTPVLHTSSRIPAERGATTMVLPIAQHVLQSNAVIVYDLMTDPEDLLALPAEDIRERVFVDRASLPEDVTRIPLKLVHTNKAPALAPLSVLAGVDTARIGLDPELCLRHAARLQSAGPALAEKVRDVFAVDGDWPDQDVESALYGGFVPPQDQALATSLRRSAPDAWAGIESKFRDKRLRELAFRYRARHAPHLLTAAEAARYESWRRDRLIDGRMDPHRTVAARLAQVAECRLRPDITPTQSELLDAVEQWIHGVAGTVSPG